MIHNIITQTPHKNTKNCFGQKFGLWLRLLKPRKTIYKILLGKEEKQKKLIIINVYCSMTYLICGSNTTNTTRHKLLISIQSTGNRRSLPKVDLGPTRPKVDSTYHFSPKRQEVYCYGRQFTVHISIIQVQTQPLRPLTNPLLSNTYSRNIS